MKKPSGQGSIADQFASLGLVDPAIAQKVDQQKADRSQTAAGQQRGKIKTFSNVVSQEELENSPNMSEFKRLAQEMLQRDHTQIRTVINAAHKVKLNSGEHSTLIHFVYQVKEGLEKCPKGREEELVARAFRRHNPKFTL